MPEKKTTAETKGRENPEVHRIAPDLKETSAAAWLHSHHQVSQQTPGRSTSGPISATKMGKDVESQATK